MSTAISSPSTAAGWRDDGARSSAFGELLLRLTAPGRELLLQSGRLDVHVGGAEANVAVGLARLGHDAAMVSRVPDNALGDAAAGHLRRYGVDATGGLDRAGADGPLFPVARARGCAPPTSSTTARAAPSRWPAPEDFDWDALLAGADLLHLSGITPALGQGSADAALAAAEAARAQGIPISFDGNYRAQLWARWDSDPRAILRPLVAQADILFGNHRDISLLLGRDFSAARARSGGARRPRPPSPPFRNLQLIASTARHVTDADTHRIAARIDSARRRRRRPTRSSSPGSSTGSAPATPSPPASCTACSAGSISTRSSTPGWR